MADLAVLLRNCAHDSTTTNGSTHIRYALKCDSFSIQIAKTPIQVPIPKQAPEIIDIGFYRPSISIGGIIDTIGQNTSNTSVHGFRNMEFIDVTRRNWIGSAGSETYITSASNITSRYYIPYKNALEDAVYQWITTANDALELEIGDANYPIYNTAAEYQTAEGNNPPGTPLISEDARVGGSETGGGVYVVAIQQARFQVDPAQEDRWQFQMQFVCESRKDVLFT